MAFKLISGPSETPIDKDYVKPKLRVDFTDDDAMIEGFIEAETAKCDGPDGFLKRGIIDQTWDYYADAFPANNGEMEIPLGNVLEVEGVFSSDLAGVETEFGASSYSVDLASEPPRLLLLNSASWPTPTATKNAVRVRLRAGYVDNGESPPIGEVPEDIKFAIFLRVKADYDDNDSSDRLRAVADNILRQKSLNKRFA